MKLKRGLKVLSTKVILNLTSLKYWMRLRRRRLGKCGQYGKRKLGQREV